MVYAKKQDVVRAPKDMEQNIRFIFAAQPKKLIKQSGPRWCGEERAGCPAGRERGGVEARRASRNTRLVYQLVQSTG